MSCVICYERMINTVYVPCGHRSSCYECSVYSEDCPICQLPANCFRTFDVTAEDDSDITIKPEIKEPMINIVKEDEIIRYYDTFNKTIQNNKNQMIAIKQLCGTIMYRSLNVNEKLNKGQSIRYFMIKKNGTVQLSSERFVEYSTDDMILLNGISKKNEIPKTSKIYVRMC